MYERVRICGYVTSIDVVSESMCEVIIESRVYIIPAVIIGEAVVNIFRKLFKENDYIEASGRVADGKNSAGKNVFAINVIHSRNSPNGNLIDIHV